MPNKKQSARPAGSGWLMATALLSLPALRIGVQRFGLTLSELEELCRFEAEFEMTHQGERGHLPWRKDVHLSAGLNLSEDEDDNAWSRVEDLMDSFALAMEKEDKNRKRKGRDSSGNPRRTFSSWLLPRESLLVILGRSGSEYRWKLEKELRARSALLGSELSPRGEKPTKLSSGNFWKVLELSREINRKRRAEILAEIEQREVEIDAYRWRITGLRKFLKNYPEKLG